MSDYLERTHNGKSFVGSDVEIVRGAALASALGLYAKAKITMSGVGPMRLLKLASDMTGKTYKRGQYMEAAQDVLVVINDAKDKPRTGRRLH